MNNDGYKLYRVRLEAQALVVATSPDEAADYAEMTPECFEGEVVATAAEASRKDTSDEEMKTRPWATDLDVDDIPVEKWLDIMEERERQAFAQAEFNKKQLKLPKVE